jgi:hypothetical protein
MHACAVSSRRLAAAQLTIRAHIRMLCVGLLVLKLQRGRHLIKKEAFIEFNNSIVFYEFYIHNPPPPQTCDETPYFLYKVYSVTCTKDYIRGFGLVLGFIGFLDTQRVTILYKSLLHARISVHGQVFTSRCSGAASNGESFLSTRFPNYSWPQLPAYNSNSSQPRQFCR